MLFTILSQLTDLAYLTIVDLYSHFVLLPFSNWGVCQTPYRVRGYARYQTPCIVSFTPSTGTHRLHAVP
jgi:hypothetical protein